MEQTIHNIQELEDYARGFLETLEAKEGGATIVGLSGDLGSGKTAFTKVAAKTLGISHEILSPTFVIAKFYPIPQGQKWSQLVHIDAYRIDDPAELRPLKWDAIIADPNNLVLVEWPENIELLFPVGSPLLRFRFIDEGRRGVTRA